MLNIFALYVIVTQQGAGVSCLTENLTQKENVCYSHPKRTETGLHSMFLRDISTLFPSKEYCAHANMTMAIKYGLPTSIAIMTNLPANIILSVDLWLMITRSFPTRVMKISLVKA